MTSTLLSSANLKASDNLALSHNRVEHGISQSLKAMGLDYIDLYLMHFPMGPLNAFDHVPVCLSSPVTLPPTSIPNSCI